MWPDCCGEFIVVVGLCNAQGSGTLEQENTRFRFQFGFAGPAFPAALQLCPKPVFKSLDLRRQRLEQRQRFQHIRRTSALRRNRSVSSWLTKAMGVLLVGPGLKL